MGIQINGNTNNINAGIGSLSIEDINELDIVGVATAANFKTGVSNLHSVGLSLSGGQIDVGSNIKIGNAGVITATSFVGSGANLTGLTIPGGGTGLDLNDNARIRLGTGNDLQIWHNGSESFISEAGTGGLTMYADHLKLENPSGEKMIYATSNGAVELYYNNTKFFETTSEGIKISTPSSTSTDANLLHLVGGGTATRGLKIGTGRASGASQNHAAAIYDAIDSESNAYGAQHRFKIAGTDCFTIGYNGDKGFVGINDSVPYPDSVSGNTVNTCLELGSPSGTDTASVIKFVGRDGSGNGNKCQIQWAGANNRFDITVNGNQALQIQPNKDVEITDGNLVIGTAGHGIDFSSTGQGGGSSTMSSELLNDYEVGTWVPVANGFTASATYHANYTKIGRLVHITMWVQTASGSSGNPFYISGLPYTVRGGQNCYQYACGRLGSNSYTNSQSDIVFEFTPNNTTIFPKVQDGGMNWGMASGTHVMITGSYISD